MTNKRKGSRLSSKKTDEIIRKIRSNQLAPHQISSLLNVDPSAFSFLTRYQPPQTQSSLPPSSSLPTTITTTTTSSSSNSPCSCSNQTINNSRTCPCSCSNQTLHNHHESIQQPQQEQAESHIQQPQHVNDSIEIGGGLSDSMFIDNDDQQEFMERFQRLSLDRIKFNLVEKDHPMFEGSNVSFADFNSYLLSFFARSKLPKAMMEELISNLNNLIKPIVTEKIPTLKTLNKRFHNVKKVYTKVYYCSVHKCLLNDGDSTCPHCKSVSNTKSSTIRWFFIRTIEDCILEIIDLVGFQEFKAFIRKPDFSSETIRDGWDGVEYERIIHEWYDDSDDCLCCTISGGTDGASAAKSNHSSINPMLFWINEIPLLNRFSYPLTNLVAYANHKVPYDILLDKFVSELVLLDKGKRITTRSGIQFTLKVRLYQMICDLVAIQELLHIAGHAGFCGCRYCNQHGSKCQGSAVLYSVGEGVQGKVTRDWQYIMEQYKKMQQGEISNFDGINAITILSRLEYFHWNSQLSCDILHNLLEGLCSKVLDYIVARYKNYLSDINDLMDNINTPSFYHRKVRNLSNIGHYKAIECYMIFGYCVNIFESFISKEHLDILQDIRELISIIMHPIDKKENTIRSLQYFIRNLFFNIENFMSVDIMSLASHSCLHFPESIWDLGPLFTNSTFMMEDAIGTIISTIKNGKVNMDYKALEAWAIHRMVALRKVRSNLFQLEKGDAIQWKGKNYMITKKHSDGGGFNILDVESQLIHQRALLDETVVPCFVVKGVFVPVHDSDKFLL